MELTDLDVELGVADVQEVLNNYLTEDAVAVQNLIRVEPGLTGGETPETMKVVVETAEAMEVDPPMVFMAESTHLPMDTGLPKAPVGTFQPEVTRPRYTPSLIGSVDTPPSPITAADNASWMSLTPRLNQQRHQRPQGLEGWIDHGVRNHPRNPE